jgi:hypothetical protein
MTPCGFFKNRRYGRTYHLYHQREEISEIGPKLVFLRSGLKMLPFANIVHSSIISQPDDGGDMFLRKNLVL